MSRGKILYQCWVWLFAFILFVAGIVVYLQGLDRKGLFESPFLKVLLGVLAGVIWLSVIRGEAERKSRATNCESPDICIPFQLASRWGMRF